MLKIITQLCLFLVGTLAPTPVEVPKKSSIAESGNVNPIRAITLCPAIVPQHGIIQSKSETIAYFEHPRVSSQLKVEL